MASLGVRAVGLVRVVSVFLPSLKLINEFARLNGWRCLKNRLKWLWSSA